MRALTLRCEEIPEAGVLGVLVARVKERSRPGYRRGEETPLLVGVAVSRRGGGNFRTEGRHDPLHDHAAIQPRRRRAHRDAFPRLQRDGSRAETEDGRGDVGRSPDRGTRGAAAGYVGRGKAGGRGPDPRVLVVDWEPAARLGACQDIGRRCLEKERMRMPLGIRGSGDLRRDGLEQAAALDEACVADGVPNRARIKVAKLDDPAIKGSVSEVDGAGTRAHTQCRVP